MYDLNSTNIASAFFNTKLWRNHYSGIHHAYSKDAGHLKLGRFAKKLQWSGKNASRDWWRALSGGPESWPVHGKGATDGGVQLEGASSWLTGWDVCATYQNCLWSVYHTNLKGWTYAQLIWYSLIDLNRYIINRTLYEGKHILHTHDLVASRKDHRYTLST